MGISIGQLKKHVETLEKSLIKKGFYCHVDYFASGKGCDYYNGSSSYVSLYVNYEEESFHFKFWANGYSPVERRNGDVIEVGSWNMKWSEMKQEVLDEIGGLCGIL